VFTVPGGNEPVPGEMTTTDAVIVSENVLFAVFAVGVAESVTSMMRFDHVPAAVGVPEIAPWPFILKPMLESWSPEESTLNVYGARPPVASIVAL
jgi:hypothetical protein